MYLDNGCLLRYSAAVRERVSVWLDQKQRQQLADRAKLSGRTVASLIRAAIDDQELYSSEFARAGAIAKRHGQEVSEVVKTCLHHSLSIFESNPLLAPVAPGDDSTPRSAKPASVSATGPRRKKQKLPPVDLTPDAQPTDGQS